MKKQIITKTKNGETLIINISTDGCGGNQYFSITGEIYKAGKPLTDRNAHACGRIHDEILEARPDLKPLVDIHLSNLDGVPMYSVENGFYWLAKAAGIKMKYEPEQDAETSFSYLCDHLRISEQEGNKILGEIVCAYIDGKAKNTTSLEVTEKCRQMQHEQGVLEAKNLFRKQVDNMKPRWKKEAESALALIESL